VGFVGRAFRHDKKAVFSTGVLTPDGLKAHFSAASLAAGGLDFQVPHKLVSLCSLEFASAKSMQIVPASLLRSCEKNSNLNDGMQLFLP